MNSSDWQKLCDDCHLGKFQEAKVLSENVADTSWYLQTSSGAFLVKTALSRYLPLLVAEADALKAIAQTNTLRCPQVMGMYHGVKWVGLVLEWLLLSHKDQHQHQRFQLLAEKLAALHGQHAKSFGWHANNFLELSPQPNVHLGDWVSFLRSQRLLVQVKMAKDRGLSHQVIATIEWIMTHLDVIFHLDLPGAVLIHGNLSFENIAFLADDEPVIFQPASYYGDPLMDIARAKLSGHFPEVFYTTYWLHAKHRKKESMRVAVYQLYYLLHYFNHFGGKYTQLVSDTAHTLRTQIEDFM